MPKDKCGWCGLKFDYIKYKPKLLIEDINEYLCEKCAKEYEDTKENIIEKIKQI